MADLQNQLAEAVLKDPDVVNLSSFVGVDGTNQTLNTGRFLITLKPHDERNLNASEIIRRLQSEVSGIVGITLYMQPVQDLTIDSTISRAPYHFVLEDANAVGIQHLGAEAGAAARASCRRSPTSPAICSSRA